MTIDSLFNKVIDKERSDLIASNPNKDMPPLKDFNDLLKCEKQADQQLEIIKEFVENFTSFMNTLCTTPIKEGSNQVGIDYLLNILYDKKHMEDYEEFSSYKETLKK